MIEVIKITKHKLQSLKKLLKSFSPFPNCFSKLSPRRKGKDIVIPYYGEDDSKFVLAITRIAWLGFSRKATTEELVENFSNLDKEAQEFVAYSLSHELKVTTLAVSIALANQSSTVFEVGPGFGFSSLYYSRLMREKKVSPSKPICKLQAIEIDKGFFQEAKKLQDMASKEIVGEVEFVLADANEFLMASCREGDVIFGSMVQPDLCNTILELSFSSRINFVISYGEAFDFRTFNRQIDHRVYEIYPFKDREFKVHVPYLQKRYGVLALTTNH